MKNHYEIGSVVFGKWSIARRIGAGSFGTVYEIRREEFGQTYTAALKVITVPQNETELQDALDEGMTQGQAEDYFYTMVKDIVREFAIMARLKGTGNVVSYEDHEVVPHDDGMGWDILIRMELLTPLLEYAYDHPFSRRDIIRLGIDMCRALELCQKYNIIHRDVKPENVMLRGREAVLIDFDASRVFKHERENDTQILGTMGYAAPEQYGISQSDSRADIYSLGVLLNIMLTGQHPSRELAAGRMGRIVQKCTMTNPQKRYKDVLHLMESL